MGRIRLTIVLLAATLVCGCQRDEAPNGGKDENTSSAPAAATSPKDALLSMVKCISSRDKAQFMASIYTTDPEWAEITFAFWTGEQAFLTQAQKAYGDDAAKSLDLNVLDFPTVEEIESKLVVSPKGGVADAVVPGKEALFTMIEEDGVWRVDMTGEQPLPADRDDDLKSTAAMIAKLKELQTRIGQKGYTVDKLNEELAAASGATTRTGDGDPGPPE